MARSRMDHWCGWSNGSVNWHIELFTMSYDKMAPETSSLVELSAKLGSQFVSACVVQACVDFIKKLKDSSSGEARSVKLKSPKDGEEGTAEIAAALVRDLCTAGVHARLMGTPGVHAIRWAGSEEDDLVCGRVRAWLTAWAPNQLAWQSPPMAIPHLQRLDAAMRQRAQSCVPDWDDNASETKSLLMHVIGPVAGVLGASGLPYLYHLSWQPYYEDKPQGKGQVQAILTDGCGVFMVVLIKELWLLRTPKKKWRKPATAVSRAEVKRREQRHMARKTAVRNAQAFEQHHVPRGEAFHVVAAVCTSHGEGLEVVVQNAYAKAQEEALAKALIPKLSIGPVTMPGEQGSSLQPVPSRQQPSLHHAMEPVAPAHLRQQPRKLKDTPGAKKAQGVVSGAAVSKSTHQTLHAVGYAAGLAATAAIIYFAWQRRSHLLLPGRTSS